MHTTFSKLAKWYVRKEFQILRRQNFFFSLISIKKNKIPKYKTKKSWIEYSQNVQLRLLYLLCIHRNLFGFEVSKCKISKYFRWRLDHQIFILFNFFFVNRNGWQPEKRWTIPILVRIFILFFNILFCWGL